MLKKIKHIKIINEKGNDVCLKIKEKC